MWHAVLYNSSPFAESLECTIMQHVCILMNQRLCKYRIKRRKEKIRCYNAKRNIHVWHNSNTPQCIAFLTGRRCPYWNDQEMFIRIFSREFTRSSRIHAPLVANDRDTYESIGRNFLPHMQRVINIHMMSILCTKCLFLFIERDIWNSGCANRLL